jgi:glycosyltransferase involved in cell wall biosynthesis
VSDTPVRSGQQPGRISVVVPTFRRPRELGEAIASVLAQGPVVLEVIVVDDSPEGSAAEVAAAAAGADARVRYARMPEPSGGYAGRVRNFGLAQAGGEFVHFLDDDDLVPPGVHGRAVEALDRDPGIGMVFGRIEPFGESEALVAHERQFFAAAARRGQRRAARGSRLLLGIDMTFNTTMMVCSAGLVRRACADAVGGFDPQMRHMEDVDFHSRVMRAFGGRYLEHTCLRYRIGPSLMRQAEGVEASVLEAYGRMHAAYRERWGVFNYALSKLLARALSRTH